MSNNLQYKKEISKKLKEKAINEGFSISGIASIPGSSRLKLRTNALERWLSNNNHGEMKWMEAERRKNINLLLEGARSVLSVGLTYINSQDNNNKNFKVGYIALEESVKRTALGIMGVALKKPLHLTREGIDETRLQETFNATVGNGGFYLYNHFGSTASDNLISKIRYLAKACGVDFVVLDHLHMALSSVGDETTNDERKLIDYTVSKLRSLVEETGIGLILVSHLRRSTEGDKGFEDGKQVTLSSLRGSQAIAQLSDLVISMSRDLKSEKNIADIYILKNRFSGETGKACSLYYDLETGCLSEVKKEVQDDF